MRAASPFPYMLEMLSDPDVAFGSFPIRIEAPGAAFRLISAVANWPHLDPGPGDELAVLHDGGLSVFRAGAPAPLWEVPFSEGEDLAVANLDADPALEIAVGTSSPFYVLRGLSSCRGTPGP